MKIIIFNGPPGSGKDTAAAHIIANNWRSYRLDRFSAPLKAMVPALLGLTHEELEERKDEPLHHGLSYRELQISASETWLKKIWGSQVFGMLLGERILRQHENTNWVIPDSGFTEELAGLSRALIDSARKHHILFIRLHRPGHTFDHDSRDYLPARFLTAIPYLTFVDLHNDRSLKSLYLQMKGIASPPSTAR